MIRESDNCQLRLVKGKDGKGEELEITIPLDKGDLGLSQSQKTVLIASTHGAIEVKDGVKLSLNVYKPNPKYKKPEKTEE